MVDEAICYRSRVFGHFFKFIGAFLVVAVIGFFFVNPSFAVPRKGNICAAGIALSTRASILGNPESSQAIINFRSFRVKELEMPSVAPVSRGTVRSSDRDPLKNLKRRKLAERIRLLEAHYAGEKKLDHINGLLISGGPAIETFIRMWLAEAERANLYHPGTNFGHWFFWFFAGSMMLQSPGTIFDPSNPNWKMQALVFIPGLFVTAGDSLLNRLFGNGHLLKANLKELARAVKSSPKAGAWNYFSYEMNLPEPLVKQTLAMREVSPDGMAYQLAAEDLGALRRLFYIKLAGRRKPTWTAFDCLLRPNREGDDWELSLVFRSDIEKPKVPRVAPAPATNLVAHPWFVGVPQ